MKSKLSNEYRCKCGKLLFKGGVSFSSIETKCKRCGSVNLFQGNKKRSTVSFGITTDSFGKIIDTCQAVSLLGFPQEHFLGKNIKDLFPFIGEEKSKNLIRINHDFSFPNKNNRRPMESYVIPRSENGKFEGWQIFNKFFNG